MAKIMDPMLPIYIYTLYFRRFGYYLGLFWRSRYLLQYVNISLLWDCIRTYTQAFAKKLIDLRPALLQTSSRSHVQVKAVSKM